MIRSLMSKFVAASIVVLPCVIVCYSQSSVPQKADAKPTDWIDQTLEHLTLEQKIGQMLQIRCYVERGDGETPEFSNARGLISKFHIGSIILGMHVNASGPLRNLPLDVANTANKLQSVSGIPLLIAADLERGLSSRMVNVPSFPWPMAFGAARDPHAVERFAAITARQARSVGIQWALAPVADVNSNPSNPVINDRSFGEDADEVGALVESFVKGARANGLLVTAKHFPGQGNTTEDSHLEISNVDADLRHLEDIEFRPFRRAIAMGVDSIMLAHARVPAIDPDPDKIATISSKVVTDVLRRELGFRGLILTDALEMKGITKLYPPQVGSPTAKAAVDAVKAGCDVIMIPTDLSGAFDAILEAVRRGDISLSRIDASVRRILAMKASVGLPASRYVEIDKVAQITSMPSDWEFAQTVSDNALTLVRSDGHTLPVQKPGNHLAVPSEKRLVAILLAASFEAGNGHEFEAALKARRPDALVYYVDNQTANAGGIQVLESATHAEEVIVVAYLIHQGAPSFVVNGVTKTSYGLNGPSGVFLTKVLERAGNVIVAALGSPYLIENFPQIQNYICGFAMASTTEISLVKGIFGEIQNTASLPISLPGVAPRGFSIPWPKSMRVKADKTNDHDSVQFLTATFDEQPSSN
jgi:beta-N-acetylhexosaminidase